MLHSKSSINIFINVLLLLFITGGCKEWSRSTDAKLDKIFHNKIASNKSVITRNYEKPKGSLNILKSNSMNLGTG